MLQYRIMLWGAVLAMALLVISCSKPSPTKTTYYDDLISLIQDSADGRELYSKDIYPPEPFRIDDTTLARFSFDSTSRSYKTSINTNPVDIFGFKSINTASVEINDGFYGRLYLIRGSDSAYYSLTARLLRRAFFLKLYDDAHLYHGWRFWVYGSGCGFPECEVGTFRSAAGEQFASSQTAVFSGYSIEKNDMARLPLNDSLTYISQMRDRLFAEDNAGQIAAFSAVPDGSNFKTGWRIPRTTTRFFHLITVEAPWKMLLDTTFSDTGVVAVDTSFEKLWDLIVPYKADI
jgi:hypothetical protein